MTADIGDTVARTSEQSARVLPSFEGLLSVIPIGFTLTETRPQLRS